MRNSNLKHYFCKIFKTSYLKNFEALGLSQPLLDGLAEMGFENPTEIQQQAIPILLQHDGDFIGLAQTGTGKTAAFGIPLLELMDTSSDDTQALILAPTRELAQQICKQLDLMSSKLGKLKIVPVFGGANIMGQIKDLRRGAQVIVATPGRLMDLMKRKEVRLDSLRFMVLDEADEMLNMGFKEDIDYILSKSDMGRNIWLFSATMAREIKQIVNTYMNNPQEVKVNRENIVNTNISHEYVQLKASDKIEGLRRMLDYDQDMFGVVFCRTKRDTQNVADQLNNNGYSTEALHGDMSQHQRDAAMKRFRDKNINLLIATDVAARGIDVDDITHVIHLALPDDPEFYTHRSGRTARAGKKGVSMAFVTKGDTRKLKFLERKLGINFEKGEIPKIEDIADKRINRWTEQLIVQDLHKKLNVETVDGVMAALEGITKEQLVMKFLSREFESIYKRSSITDVNDRSKGRDRDSGKDRGYKTNGKEEGMKTFFLNLGRKDDVNKGAILGFICDVTGIKGKEVGRILVEGAHSFIDVSEEVAPLMKVLDGAQRDGRELRCNEHKGEVRRSRDRGRSGGRDRNRGRGGKKRENDNGSFKGRSKRSDFDKSGSRPNKDDKVVEFPSKRKGNGSKGKSKKKGRSNFFGSKWD